ncbi:MAG: sigma 54-interacting transcriptional regulator [Desulfobacterales bacterium]|nr:sigma 54-interacting transcriptional regulator [Desulfobacterales bacterium]
MTLPLAVGGRIQCAHLDGRLHAAPASGRRLDVNRLRIIGEILANALRSQAPRRRTARAPRRDPGAARPACRPRTSRCARRSGAARLRRDRRPERWRSAWCSRGWRRWRPTDAAVLLLGETGTGKELLARALHERSPRSGAPVRAGQLRGHSRHAASSRSCSATRRAPSPARWRRAPGRFEAAHGGTLFLDEIGELGIDVQAKLLRVLQDGDVRARRLDAHASAVGCPHRRRHQPRPRARHAPTGGFREDLYYRLSVFPIRLPPLRDRREDIPLLRVVDHQPPAARARAGTSSDVPQRAHARPRSATTGRATCASWRTSSSAR